jgi:hypothetical protein
METIEEENADKQLHVRIRKSDYELIRQNAKAAGLNVSEYVRQAAIGMQIEQRLLPRDLENLRKIGINLNQVAKFANTYQQWPTEIEAIITIIKGIVQPK